MSEQTKRRGPKQKPRRPGAHRRQIVFFATDEEWEAILAGMPEPQKRAEWLLKSVGQS
jgi:hypothetical protein